MLSVTIICTIVCPWVLMVRVLLCSEFVCFSSLQL
jgi:hypothetical protein